MIYKFYDANGHLWIYNSIQKRVYMAEAEIEMGGLPGFPAMENGYYANSIGRAIRLLEEYGYMDKETKDD